MVMEKMPMESVNQGDQGWDQGSTGVVGAQSSLRVREGFLVEVTLELGHEV